MAAAARRLCLLLAAALPLHAAASFLPAGKPTRPARRLNASSICRAVALRLMPTPAVRLYDQCFAGKLASTGAHDWSVPGAEVAAQVDCWCRHNLTATIREYSCCEHSDIYPMCSVDCTPDCASELARSCVRECPSMCFEAADYIVDASICGKCRWEQCWPVVKCMTNHAEQRVDGGMLQRTCDEPRFREDPKLAAYMRCWKTVPKHTSHWNILSSLVHCMCREDMKAVTESAHCCSSVTFGGGICDLECMSEQACATQEAQTCIHRCQRLCPAYEVVPSHQCAESCLAREAQCRKYVSCRPPSVSTHVCDDGRWPEASSGCCVDNATMRAGCPRLCEIQRVWRLDRTRAVPWWARIHHGHGIVAQCTCVNCPESPAERFALLRQTVSESIWDNGQVMLVDIARREGLRLGPNRRMQELMLQRNNEITEVLNSYGGSLSDKMVAEISDRYAALISAAARLGEDPALLPAGSPRRRGDGGLSVIAVTLAACSGAILLAIAAATWLILRKKTQETPVTAFNETDQVVMGSPVALGPDVNGVATGAPVTVSAPTKKGGKEAAKDLD